MDVATNKIIVWLIVGALAGSFTGILIKRNRQGFGHIYNTFIGVVGAFIGGIIFNTFKIDFGLGNISISLKDLVSACIGSLVFLFIMWILRKGK